MGFNSAFKGLNMTCINESQSWKQAHVSVMHLRCKHWSYF